MKKEIDQRSKNKLYFPCVCGHPHFLELDFDLDPGWKHYYASIIDNCNMGFWDRLKSAIKFLKGKQNLNWMDVELNSKDLKKIKIHIDKYLTESENGKSK